MTVTTIAERRRRAQKQQPEISSSLRVVDGNRSPWFSTLKRKVDLQHRYGTYHVDLGEQRQLVIPWLRIPYFTYWRIRRVYAYELEKLEIVARSFLETGHVPAAWWLG